MSRPDSRVPVVLGSMRVILHVGFALLLAIGLLRALREAQSHAAIWLTVLLAALLAIVYVIGTVREKHLSERSAAEAEPAGVSRAAALLWLGLVTALWLGLVVSNEHFAWVGFPLFFLHLHILRTGWAIASVLGLTAAIVTAQWLHSHTLQPATVLGPLLGAGVSIVMALVYQALSGENARQRRTVAELIRTRGELAAAQHTAGQLTERERLAQEIHDTLAQGFSSIVLVSRAARSAVQAGQEDTAGEYIDTIERTAAENLAEARSFVRDLATGRPRSLLERLPQLCADAEARARAAGTALDCGFEISGDPVALSAASEAALVRCVQSALANVTAHAEADTARVTVAFFPTEVTIDVFDNGCGFDPAAATARLTAARGDGTGYGLRLLRERIARAGGDVTIESQPGAGTVIGVRLPISPVDERRTRSTENEESPDA